MQHHFPPRFLDTIDKVIKAHGDDRSGVSAAAVIVAMTYGKVTVDDLRDLVTAEGDNRWFGSILQSLVTRGILKKTGMQKTRRKTSHGRDVSVFELTLDWEQRWPRDWLNPKAQILTSDDGIIFVEEKRT